MKTKIINTLEMSGFSWMVPVVRLFSGENPREQLNDIINVIGLPLIAIVAFLFLWSGAASQVKTSLGELPGPVQVWEQAKGLYEEHVAEREKEADFYLHQAERNAKKLEDNPDVQIKWRDYTGKPTFLIRFLPVSTPYSQVLLWRR